MNWMSETIFALEYDEGGLPLDLDNARGNHLAEEIPNKGRVEEMEFEDSVQQPLLSNNVNHKIEKSLPLKTPTFPLATLVYSVSLHFCDHRRFNVYEIKPFLYRILLNLIIRLELPVVPVRL